MKSTAALQCSYVCTSNMTSLLYIQSAVNDIILFAFIFQKKKKKKIVDFPLVLYFFIYKITKNKLKQIQNGSVSTEMDSRRINI